MRNPSSVPGPMSRADLMLVEATIRLEVRRLRQSSRRDRSVRTAADRLERLATVVATALGRQGCESCHGTHRIHNARWDAFWQDQAEQFPEADHLSDVPAVQARIEDFRRKHGPEFPECRDCRPQIPARLAAALRERSRP